MKLVLASEICYLWKTGGFQLMLPLFKVLKGLIDIDVSHFVDFYANCDYYSFRHYDHLMLGKKYARTNTP